MTHKIEIEESDRQLVVLALAKLSVHWPTFAVQAERVAALMDNRYGDGKPQMFLQMRDELIELIRTERKPYADSELHH